MQRTLVVETTKKVGKKVKVAGWVHSRRDHGKIIFIDLRDQTGLLQVVFTPHDQAVYVSAQQLRPEFVVSIVGTVSQRPSQMVNDKIATGTVELQASKL